MSTGWAALVVLLWIAVLVLAILVLGINAKLRELSAPAASTRPRLVPDVGASVDLGTLAQNVVLGPDGQTVVFVSAGCGPCLRLTQSLRDHVTRGNASLAALLGTDVVFVSDDESLVDGLGVQSVTDSDGRIQHAFSVFGTPVGVRLSAAGTVITAGPVNSLQDIRMLGQPADALSITVDTISSAGR